MRKDMNKVIVERPRRHKYGDAQAARRRNDFEGPMKLGVRAGYGYRELSENLSPLRRYLRSQVGRPWSKSARGFYVAPPRHDDQRLARSASMSDHAALAARNLSSRS